MSGHDPKDQLAPQASDEATELNDDTLEEVAGGYTGTKPLIDIGPPPTFPEPEILY